MSSVRLFPKLTSFLTDDSFRSHWMPELDDPQIFQSVLEGLQTGIYFVDRARRILFWNDGAEKITGYLRQDIVGRFLRDHFFAATDETNGAESDAGDPVNLVFRDGIASTTQVSILHKEGYRVPIILRTNPIRDSRGMVVGAAESFDRNVSASDRTRRQAGLVDVGCLDEMTGVSTAAFMQTQLRENLTNSPNKIFPSACWSYKSITWTNSGRIAGRALRRQFFA